MQIALAALVVVMAGSTLLHAPPAVGQAVPVPGVLRVALSQAETGFDPQALADAASSTVADAIFEPLYRHALVARTHRDQVLYSA